MDLRTLVVEDRDNHFNVLKVKLDKIGQALQRQICKDASAPAEGRPFGKVILDRATNRDSARDMLSKAARSRPYHLLLADLNITSDPESTQDDVQFGLEVLDFSRESGGARQVLAISAFPTETEALRHRADDWISKLANEKDLQEKLLTAWNNIIAIECQDVLRCRLRWLLPQVQYIFTARFGKRFAQLLEGATQATRDLRSLLPERMLIDFDRDNQDPIVQEIDRLDCVVEKSKVEWNLLAGGGGESPRVTPVRLEDQLSKAFEQIEPLWIQRKADWRRLKGQTEVAAFGGNVESVLRELLMGPLLEGPLPDARKIDITVTIDGGFANLMIQDSLPPMNVDDVQKINLGAALAPDEEFGRTWGLSVVNHTAVQGGGSIAVRSSASGNDVIYKIPLMN